MNMLFSSKRKVSPGQSELLPSSPGRGVKRDGVTRALKRANRFFLLCSLVFLGYISYKVFFTAEDQGRQIPVLKRVTQIDMALASIVLPEGEDFEAYGDVFSEREIFQANPVSNVNQPEEEQPQQQPMLDLSKNYKLVGIILAAQPRAVVENLQNQETVFLSIGDKLENAVLKKVQQGKAIFGYLNQEIELNQ